MKNFISFFKKHDSTIIPLTSISCIEAWVLTDIGFLLAAGFLIVLLPILLLK